MSERKELGRITSATFGFGGYDGACIGFALQFGGGSWGCGTFIGTWSGKPSDHAKWTEDDQSKTFADAVRKLGETLSQARKQHVGELVGTPVEVTFDGNLLKEWRVLTEVLP